MFQNYRRVAEVWMDEYAEHLYSRRPHYRNISPGDISEQKALRERLHCKPFKWFITQVHTTLPSHFIAVCWLGRMITVGGEDTTDKYQSRDICHCIKRDRNLQFERS